MRQAQRSFGIERHWPEAIVVYPQGLPTKGMTDPEGKKPGWQKKKGDYEDRDLAFFDAMLGSLKPKIDPARIYATGHSNGGRMTYLLWAERFKALAAVAPSSSPAFGLLRDLKPLPAFIIAGEKDKVVPFRSQSMSIEGVRRLMNTDPARAKTEGFVRLEPGSNGLELGTYIHPGDHTFPGKAVAPMIAFFKRHTKPVP